MDILIRTLAVLTLLWGGWIYLKSSDADTELRRIRNELELTKQELVNAQATYEAEVKKREMLAGEVDALKNGSQELRKAITAKKEEKRQRSAQERQERLAAERKAREEDREARMKEQKQKRAQLERDRQYEREEEEREKAEDAKSEAEYEMQLLQSQIEARVGGMKGYLKCSAYAPSGKKSSEPLVEGLKRRWTSSVQACIEATRDGDSENFERSGTRLLSVAKSIDHICGGGYTADATYCIDEGRKILELKKQMRKLKKNTH